MDQVTLDALKASIAAWEKKAVAEDVGDVLMGTKNCPLCQLFYDDVSYCHGCPVSNETSQGGCWGTPYVRADDALDRWKWPLWRQRDIDADRAALANIDAKGGPA